MIVGVASRIVIMRPIRPAMDNTIRFIESPPIYLAIALNCLKADESCALPLRATSSTKKAAMPARTDRRST